MSIQDDPIEHPSRIALLLAEELHRRQVRFDHGPPMTSYVRTQVEGELIGLRVALGIALGHKGASGDVVVAARHFYQRWLSDRQALRVTP